MTPENQETGTNPAPKVKKKPKRHPKLPATHPANRMKEPRSRAVAIHRPAPPAAPQNFLQVVATAVMDPRCDVEKMKALLDMQERIEDRDAKKAFTVAFNALQADLPVINRDGKIDHGDGVTAKGNRKLKTTYATYPNLMSVCRPLLKKNGFTLSNTVKTNAAGLMVITGHLEHVQGHSRETDFTLGADTTGGKNNQQGWGSSQQYGMRYNAIALLNITTEAKQDADNDGFAVAGTISAAQLKVLVSLKDTSGADVGKFCELMGVNSMAEITIDRFEEAKKQLERKLAAKQKKAQSDFPGDR